MITLKQLAIETGLSYDTLKKKLYRNDSQLIEVADIKYRVERIGRRYYVMTQNDITAKQSRYLTDAEREAAYNDLIGALLAGMEEADAMQRIAEQYNVSGKTIRRLYKSFGQLRKKRSDSGLLKSNITNDVLKDFEAYYIRNAQANVRLAYDLVRKKYAHMQLPSYMTFWRYARTLEPLRVSYHYQSQFEKEYTPRLRRDLWAEYEFMECVTLDCWTVPDRVLQSWGLNELTMKKFKHRAMDISFIIIMAVDSKTGYPLAWRALERSVNSEDVMSVLLEVVYNWGRPNMWLMDNGSEFVNESVQRFLRGLYTTEEHEAKRRILFSEAYQPYGKGRHERLHRIFKDEFCAFSDSYSPNQQESRKPTRRLSYVKPMHTLEEWREKFGRYLSSIFMDRERDMWLNPLYSKNSLENKNRPRTMREAFERAYITYTKVSVPAEKLAYLYGKKFRAKLKAGVFTTPASISPIRLTYIPCEEGIPYHRYHEIFEIVINPMNTSQAWIYDMRGMFVCEAKDFRYSNVAQPTQMIAKEYRKIRNKALKEAKKLATLKLQQAHYEDLLKAKGKRETVASEAVEKVVYDQMPQELMDEKTIAFANFLYTGQSQSIEEEHHE